MPLLRHAVVEKIAAELVARAELNDPRGETVDEISVVGNAEHRTVEAVDGILQRLA